MRKIAFLKTAIFIIGIIIFLLCVFLVPIFKSQQWLSNPEYADVKFWLCIGLYVTVIPFYIALYQTVKLLDCMKGSEAFSDIAIRSLQAIRNCAFAIVAIYIIGLLYAALSDALQNGIFLMGTVVIFSASVISVFAMVLEELLRNAMEIKSENDLTV